jgi:hypothetical protein
VLINSLDCRQVHVKDFGDIRQPLNIDGTFQASKTEAFFLSESIYWYIHVRQILYRLCSYYYLSEKQPDSLFSSIFIINRARNSL